MKILVVTQYFWPENFRINDIVLGLQERGHEVVVFTGKPNYPSGKFYKGYSFFGQPKDIWNGITIYRSTLIPRGNGSGIRLAVNYLSFVFFGCLRALFLPIQADRILVYQLSPVTLALPAILFKKKTGAPLFLYIQDLWPQSIVAAGGLSNRFLLHWLDRLTSWIYRQSDKILIQSKAFSSYLLTKKVSPDRIDYLPNSTDPFYRKVDKKEDLTKYFTGVLNIVFAGNIGEAQSLPTVLQAAKQVKKVDPSIVWLIIGDGRKKAELVEKAVAENLLDVVNFTGSFEPEMMPFFFAHADALLISLKKDYIFTLTIPNKLQSYMACGKPVLGSLDGEGQWIITDANCGLVSPAEDAYRLAENVLAFSRLSVEERSRLGLNALTYFQKEFNRDKLIDKLANLLRG